MKNGNDLTPKQQAFVDNYLISFNATDAARKAGYKGNERTLAEIGSQNLRKVDIQRSLSTRFKQAAAAADKKLINTHAGFADKLRLSERLAVACEKWLEVNGEIELDARDTEIQIIYTDPREKTALKWPKQRKGTAKELVEYLESSGKIEVEYITSKIDIRKYVIDVLSESRANLAEIARIQGDYTKEKENPSDNISIAQRVVRDLMSKGKERDEAVQFAAGRYGVLEADLISV